jgi:crotonobetainyl-CoA:carnitine CoA-transferase CaiB-like acyl-CoA transferase
MAVGGRRGRAIGLDLACLHAGFLRLKQGLHVTHLLPHSLTCLLAGFPKLKKGLTDFLQCELTVPAMASACKNWNAAELEEAMQAKGLAATKCRTPAEWRASEQGQAMASHPPITIESITRRAVPTVAASKAYSPRVLSSTASRPLSDVIVVDFSHVIASPVVGRTLADHGATVIKVVSHARPRREMFDAETQPQHRTLT